MNTNKAFEEPKHVGETAHNGIVYSGTCNLAKWPVPTTRCANRPPKRASSTYTQNLSLAGGGFL